MVRPAVAPSLLAILIALLPATSGVAAPSSAGSAEEPDISDAAGDVQTFPGIPAQEPWSGGVDILAWWANTTEEGVEFHYHFADLAAIETAVTSDPLGRTFWSHTYFTARLAGTTVTEDPLYMDYVGTVAGREWRSYLQQSDTEVPLHVDFAADTIVATLPWDVLGGNRTDSGNLTDVRVTAATTLAFPFYTVDSAPDADACVCDIAIGTPPAREEPPQPDQDDESESMPGPVLVATLAVLVVAALALRRR